ncbi:MAG TPA: hypothetical protein PLH75_11015 [Amaricoccus sp.]|nr:hypothetical protein [Amaricoccus sp.]
MTPRPMLAATLLAALLATPALHAEEPFARPAPAALRETAAPWRAVVVTRPPLATGPRALFAGADAGRLAVQVSRGRRPSAPEIPPGTDLLRVLQDACAPLPLQRAEADPVPRARVVSLEF